MDSAGSNYENFVNFVGGRIASLVRIPREQDFGIDFYAQPRTPASARTESVTELGALQVKGGSAEFFYGGNNGRGEWRDYEFAWLRSLATPLYLAQVDAACSAVELFSLWPVWWIFLRQPMPPFEVTFITQPPGSRTGAWQEPQSAPGTNASGKGDERRWTIDLGPPFLRLTAENVNDAGFRELAVRIFRTWISLDRLMLMRYLQGIPVLTGITQWQTNSTDGIVPNIWQFWSSVPGANIAGLCQTAGPILTNLGAHLQWQNDQAAYLLVPVLEWIDGLGQLDDMGRGLLNGLRETQSRGVGPADGLGGTT
jgi:hypothetical protein